LEIIHYEHLEVSVNFVNAVKRHYTGTTFQLLRGGHT